jgi:antitoxin (DNA-binding transcriptional repressor) of toxin-antitoxin stability system
MAIVTVHEAKTQPSRLIAQALAGEEVIIARGKQPTVRLVPVEPAAKPPARQFGRLKGIINVDERFFEPLPDDLLALWNCEGEDPND